MDRRLELICDNARLDVDSPGSVPIKLSYVLQDYKEIDKRGGSFSNIFNIPASKVNNEFFQHYHQTGSFNSVVPFIANKSSKVYFNGTKIFDGYLRGENVSKIRGNPDKYKVRLIGNNLTWATFLSTLKLKDVVNVVRPSFTWDEAFVRNSWTGAFNHVCPLVEYYDTVGSIPNPVRWWEMRPWIFVRPIVEEMFSQAGFTIQSEFLITYQNLICYFNDDGDNEIPTFPKTNPGVASLVVDYTQGLINDDRNCLDFLKGLIHNFNLQFNTDENRRTVEMEQYDNFFDGGYYDVPFINLDPLHDISKPDVLSSLEMNRFWRLSHQFDDRPVPDVVPDRYVCEVDFGEKFKNATTKSENPFFAGCQMRGGESIGGDPYFMRPVVQGESAIMSGACVPRICMWGGQLETLNTPPEGFYFEADAIRSWIPYCYFYHQVDMPGFILNQPLSLSMKEHRQMLVPFIIPFSQPLKGQTQLSYLNLIATMERGRIMDVNLRLSPQFIQELNFTRRYFLDGVQVIMNEISKWNPISEESTDCRLTKQILATTDDEDKLNHLLGIYEY